MKAFDRLKSLLQDTGILLICSHSRALFDRLCPRTMTLSDGRNVLWIWVQATATI